MIRCHNCGIEVETDKSGWDAICPWCDELLWLKVGEIVSCKVIRVSQFGIFVQLKEGVEGLVHVSELGRGHVRHPGEILDVGDEIQAKVLRINLSERRIGLSHRQVTKQF